MKKYLKIVLIIIITLLLLIVIDIISIFTLSKPLFAIKEDNADSVNTVYKGIFYDTYICIEYTVPQIKLKGTKYSCMTNEIKEINKKIEIKDIDGTNYEFKYKNEVFKATYTYDNWKIYNSYKITNENDIKAICKALIEIHPVHGSDMKSYRTPSDMAYEWLQHNLAYQILPKDNAWRNNAKDVDLDPKDQGKSMKEIYEDRTGNKLDF